MTTESPLTPQAWVQPAISAGAALLGILIGGWISERSRKVERRHARIKQQVDEFYGPMVGFREAIRVRFELMQEINRLGGEVWHRRFAGLRDPQVIQTISEAHKPGVEKLFEYNGREHETELLPRYRKMLEHFEQHMSLAEPSTRRHFSALVEYVAGWDRFLADGAPREVFEQLHEVGRTVEEAVLPLYADLQQQLDRLVAVLSERGGEIQRGSGLPGWVELGWFALPWSIVVAALAFATSR